MIFASLLNHLNSLLTPSFFLLSSSPRMPLVLISSVFCHSRLMFIFVPVARRMLSDALTPVSAFQSA